MDELQLAHPNKVQKLTRREVELLYYFITNQNKLIKKKDILSDLRVKMIIFWAEVWTFL